MYYFQDGVVPNTRTKQAVEEWLKSCQWLILENIYCAHWDAHVKLLCAFDMKQMQNRTYQLYFGTKELYSKLKLNFVLFNRNLCQR